MRGTPRSESEVSRLFEKGDYKFDIISASESVSKGAKTLGTPMFELKLLVHHNKVAGKTTTVFCYILNNPAFEFLIRHLYSSVGMMSDYDSGNWVASKLEGKSGFASLGVEIDKSGAYPDKNRILDFLDGVVGGGYVENVNAVLTKNINDSSTKLNDDIPF